MPFATYARRNQAQPYGINATYWHERRHDFQKAGRAGLSRLEHRMSIRIVPRGSERAPGKGVGIGTVTRPLRGNPKSAYASGNWCDVCFPMLATSVETMKLGHSADSAQAWAAYAGKYRGEMAAPQAVQSLSRHVA